MNTKTEHFWHKNRKTDLRNSQNRKTENPNVPLLKRSRRKRNEIESWKFQLNWTNPCQNLEGKNNSFWENELWTYSNRNSQNKTSNSGKKKTSNFVRNS